MPVVTYREAIKSAMAEEMERDERVVVMGEDIGLYGGTHLVTDGLLDRFGPKRVMDTPIAEGGFTGAAIGMAMAGMRPIVEMMTWNFSSRRPTRSSRTRPRSATSRAARLRCRSSFAVRTAAACSSRRNTRIAWKAFTATSPGSRWSLRQRRMTPRG